LASANYLTRNPIPYAAVSPFAKVHPARIGDLQKMIAAKLDYTAGNEGDEKNGIRRVIPHNYLQNVLNINIPEILESAKTKYSIKPLTILGEKDMLIDKDAAIKRHALLNGTTETLDLHSDYGHAIPQEIIHERIIRFMCEGLGIKLA
jgi:hypothetical protein